MRTSSWGHRGTAALSGLFIATLSVTGAAQAVAPPATPATTPATPDVAPPPPAISAESENEARLREAEKRLDKLERDRSLQRLQWGGDYRTTLSTHRFRGPSPDGMRKPDGSPNIVRLSNAEQWVHRARLDVRAEPIDTVRFTGRLTMFKRFGTNAATPFSQDSSETRIPRDNALRLERAWLDWFITPWMALSVGRVSYTDGPPNELKDNRTEPDATWGQQMVDGEYDTVDVTFRLGGRALVRGFYASWAFPLEGDLFSQNLFLNNGTDNLRIIGGNADLRVPELGKLFLQAGAYWVPEFRPFTVPIPNPQAPANPTNAPAPFNGAWLFPSSKPASLGAYSNVSVLATWKDISDTGLDLFVSGALGFLDPNDQAISYPLGPGGQAVPLLTLSSADSDKHATYFVFTGGRYKLPFGGRVAPKVGLEYNYGSRYMISFAAPTANLTNKLANRGSAYEGYYLQPINDYLWLRLSYSYIDTQHTGGFFGASAKLMPPFGGTSPAVDQHLHTLSLAINATF